MNLTKILEKFGDTASYAIPAATAGYALLTGNPIEAIATGILGYLQKKEVRAIKRLFPRERPAPYVLGQKSHKDSDSFPSSHTTRAFLGVGLAWGLYGITNPVTISTLAMASLVGASRYLSKKHWATDVAAGALLGNLHGFIGAGCRTFFRGCFD